MNSGLMANGMTTGTIGTTAEKDKCFACKNSKLAKKNKKNKQTTEQNTYALFHTTILHAENQYDIAY